MLLQLLIIYEDFASFLPEDFDQAHGVLLLNPGLVNVECWMLHLDKLKGLLEPNIDKLSFPAACIFARPFQLENALGPLRVDLHIEGHLGEQTLSLDLELHAFEIKGQVLVLGRAKRSQIWVFDHRVSCGLNRGQTGHLSPLLDAGTLSLAALDHMNQRLEVLARVLRG